jgi:hypothetical protein
VTLELEDVTILVLELKVVTPMIAPAYPIFVSVMTFEGNPPAAKPVIVVSPNTIGIT